MIGFLIGIAVGMWLGWLGGRLHQRLTMRWNNLLATRDHMMNTMPDLIHTKLKLVTYGAAISLGLVLLILAK